MTDSTPQLIVVAGPNGAGKSTFYAAHLSQLGLRFVNADRLAKELGLDAYQAADVAEAVRQRLLLARESFVFETVFSDPSGDKLSFLEKATEAGYAVTLCYIGLADSDVSQERVAMRVSQGGHDVPDEKLEARFPRTLVNLQRAVKQLPLVRIYDNSDLGCAFLHLATFQDKTLVYAKRPWPDWLEQIVR